MEAHYNRIRNTKIFDVTAFISAYSFSARPSFTPRWEEYDFSQMFLILSGTGIITTDAGTYPIRPGMLVYRPAGKRSIYEWTSPDVRFALISFVCASEAMSVFEGAPFTLYEEESVSLLDLIRTGTHVCEDIHGDDVLRGMRVKEGTPDVVLSFIYASMERFLAMVYCRLAGIHLLLDESQKVSTFARETRLVTEIKAYLAEHVTDRLRMEELCGHFWISQTALSRKFREETGKTVIDYFNDLKIEEAKRRIRKTPESFTEIAAALNFSSLNYFTKVFKTRTGRTPSEYSRYVSKRREGLRSVKD